MTSRIGRTVAWAAAGAAGLAVLLAPALWNGFPLIFYDTAGYIERGLDGTLSPGRSLAYGMVAVALMRFGFGLWPVAVAQSLLVLWVLHVLGRTLGLRAGPVMLAGLAAVLAAVTGVAWFSAQVMPDILGPLTVLGLYLLAWRWRQLHLVERAAMAALVALGVACHMSHFGLGVGLVACLGVAALVLRRRAPRFRPRVLVPALSVGAGIAGLVLANGLSAGHYGFTPGGQAFVFARLVHDGIVARFLADHCPPPAPEHCREGDGIVSGFVPGHPAVEAVRQIQNGVAAQFRAEDCPQPEYRLCEWRESMPATADDWLWGGGSPFWRIGGWEGGADEMRRIAVASLREYPWLHLTTALGSVLEQLVMFATGDGVDPNMPLVAEAFARRLPELMPDYRAARQQRGELGFAALNWVHVPVAAVSIALAMLLLPWMVRRGEADLAGLLATILLALLGNAVICGALSNPHDRYQNRMVWLTVLGVVLVLAAMWRRRPRRVAITAPPGLADPAF